MIYVATNYDRNPNAPVGKWTCSPGSALGPYDAAPEDHANGPDYCGQCVSYVRQVCRGLPPTPQWKKGPQVKGNSTIVLGTAIATFDPSGNYFGHAAIYVD